MPQILPDDETEKSIKFRNSKERKDFSVVHTLAKNNMKYDRHNVESVHIFLSGRGGTGKSHLIKVINNATSKHCFINLRTLRNQQYFYLDLQEYQQSISMEPPFILFF